MVTYELSNQCFLGTKVAHNPIFRSWFLEIVKQAQLSGVQHMPTHLSPGFVLTDEYLAWITSLHQAWRGPFRHSQNKLLAALAMPIVPSTSESILLLHEIQSQANKSFPCILYPEGKLQTVQRFNASVESLHGSHIIQLEMPHFEWFHIDALDPVAMCAFYVEQGWECCIDLVRFVKDMEASFDDLLAAMCNVTTHVHVRCGSDQQGRSAATVARELLDGTGIQYERMQAIASVCDIKHVTLEVTWPSIVAGTRCPDTREHMIKCYAGLAENVQKVFG